MRAFCGLRRPPGSGRSFPRVRLWRASITLALTLALVGAVPQTASAASAKSQLNALAAKISRLQTALATTERRAVSTKRNVAAAAARVKAARAGMVAMTQGLYMGGFDATSAMLSATSVAEFGDRISFAEHIQSGQKDVMERVAIAKRNMERSQRTLDAVAKKQKALLRSLNREQAALDRLFRKELDRLAAVERAKRRSKRASRSETVSIVNGRGPFQVCPVDSPRAYSNDWGAPRGGDRRHEGNDILAPRGTPIRAPFDGTVKANSSGRGGKQVRVYGSAGYVFNAHLESHAGVSGFVKAGTIIGYVGNSGNASGGPTHDHFEWHPGNGRAVNPFRYLNLVC